MSYKIITLAENSQSKILEPIQIHSLASVRYYLFGTGIDFLECSYLHTPKAWLAYTFSNEVDRLGNDMMC